MLNKIPHFFRLRFLACFALGFLFLSCDKVANVLENLLSFDIARTTAFPLPAQTPAGQSFAVITPFGVSNDDLVAKSTTTSLVKTIRLTAMKFRTDDASFPLANFDTLRLSVVIAGSATELVIGSYFGKTDSYKLNDSNFVSLFKDSKVRFKATMMLNKVPTAALKVISDYTFAFTADPL